MIQHSAKFCSSCGSRATPRALYCVDCGARLVPTTRHARTPRPAGARVGGRYRLRRLIDMGGNGAVYEAQHELLGTTHALKETLAGDAESVAQFLTEARLLARLDHPTLVRVTDYFVEPSGAAFLVMDYVAGDTLQHKLERNPASYTVAEVISWLLQICAGLEYLHGQQPPIIHRDVKPLNVVLGADGRIKLLDMGIAREAVLGAVTSRVARAVTEPFAPIEQYGAGTDARSDVYALGVTAYVLLTRQLPPSALERVAHPQELRVRMFNREVPPAVAAAVEKAMASKPEARYPSVDALRRAIEVGWVAGERLEQAVATGGLRRDTGGLLGAIRRALGSGAPAQEVAPAPGGTSVGLALSERLVEWRSRADQGGAVEAILALERDASGPPRLRLSLSVSQRGQRGKLSFQQIDLAEPEARAFAARLADLLRLGPRLTAEIHFESGRTALAGEWPGSRGPLALTIRTSGPRGGVKSCTIRLERRQVEALALDLQQGLRRVKPA
jgi:hypothetical protein